uniref:Uncharacterized protein n=1 Tax=Glossina palpalis gambiensis TaxID=67801 RepID=A0A1B0BIH9_9MUSC
MIICKISNHLRLQFLKFVAVYLYVTKAQPITSGVLSSPNRKVDRYTAVRTINENLTESLLRNASDNFLKSNAITEKNFTLLKAENHRDENATNFTTNYKMYEYSSGFVPIKFPDTEEPSSQTNHVRTRDDNSNYWSSGNIKVEMSPHKQRKRNQLNAQYYSNNNPDHLTKIGNAAKDDANANLPNYRSYNADAYNGYYVPSTKQYSVHATTYSIGNEMEENIPFDVYGADGQYPGSGGQYSYTLPIAQKSIASKNRSELSHKVLLVKSFLIPLASAAVLGIAAALVSNPLLLQLGTVSSAGPIVVGKRKRRHLLSLASNSK